MKVEFIPLQKMYVSAEFKTTRGHARFARSPLVIRLGDSMLRGGIEFGVAL